MLVYKDSVCVCVGGGLDVYPFVIITISQRIRPVLKKIEGVIRGV